MTDSESDGGGTIPHHNVPMDDSQDTAPLKKPSYQDAISIIDLSQCLRRFKIYKCWYFPRRLWLVNDCCGIVCCVITWLLIAYAEFVIIFVMLIPAPNVIHSVANGIFFQAMAAMALLSHARAMLSDPGAVIRGNATPENIKKLGLQEGQLVYKCPKCISIKPERAHHCSVCRRCIKKMDHHCPWINNCVGETNQKYFVLFTFYICVISFHAMYMCIHHFIVCLQDDWKMCVRYSPPVTTIFLIFLIFESLLFGIFTAIMCGTQLSAICSDETGIEQLKRENPSWERKGWWLSLTAVFGYPFNILWFSPFHEPFVKGKDEVYQYTV